jgi:hypothetical protein
MMIPFLPITEPVIINAGNGPIRPSTAAVTIKSDDTNIPVLQQKA